METKYFDIRYRLIRQLKRLIDTWASASTHTAFLWLFQIFAICMLTGLFFRRWPVSIVKYHRIHVVITVMNLVFAYFQLSMFTSKSILDILHISSQALAAITTAGLFLDHTHSAGGVILTKLCIITGVSSRIHVIYSRDYLGNGPSEVFYCSCAIVLFGHAFLNERPTWFF